jgi:hypothetical protein
MISRFQWVNVIFWNEKIKIKKDGITKKGAFYFNNCLHFKNDEYFSTLDIKETSSC